MVPKADAGFVRIARRSMVVGVHMPSDWYVVVDGESRGPFDDNRIKALVAEGRITPDTQVSRAGMKQWVAARQIKGLFPEPRGDGTPNLAPRRSAPTITPRAESPAPQGIEAIDFNAASTPSRRVVTRRAAKPDHTTNMLLACGGAAALTLGFFCPVVRLPIIGSMSYMGFLGLLARNGEMNAMAVAAFLVIAAIAGTAIMALANQPSMLLIPGIAGAIAAVVTIGRLLWMQYEMTASVKKDLEDNPFAGLAQAMVQGVSLDFGIGVIVVGAALIIAGALVPAARRK